MEKVSKLLQTETYLKVVMMEIHLMDMANILGAMEAYLKECLWMV